MTAAQQRQLQRPPTAEHRARQRQARAKQVRLAQQMAQSTVQRSLPRASASPRVIHVGQAVAEARRDLELMRRSP